VKNIFFKRRRRKLGGWDVGELTREAGKSEFCCRTKNDQSKDLDTATLDSPSRRCVSASFCFWSENGLVKIGFEESFCSSEGRSVYIQNVFLLHHLNFNCLDFD
jgi:hypothetical protein